MHLKLGEMQAYQDHELPSELIQRVEAHLDGCPRCRAQADRLRAQTKQVDKHMSGLSPTSPPPSARAAYLHLMQRLQSDQKENPTMRRKLTSRISRPAWAAITIVAVLVIALAFPQVRAVADSFLGLFRVQQIKHVEVNPGDLPERMGNSAQLETMLSRDIHFEEHGEAIETTSVEEASTAAGFLVRLPAEVKGEQALWVRPGGTATFNIDMELVRAVLKDLERSDISLPDNLDGATVKIDVPDSVVAHYGKCQLEDMQGGDPDEPQNYQPFDCTILVQMPSPTISAPPDLDIVKIGEAYLQLVGMTREEAVRFARNVDWTTTFVVPIPSYGAKYQDVQVDGVTGTLLYRDVEQEYMLLWVKDGVIFALSGSGGLQEALAIANSLK